MEEFELRAFCEKINNLSSVREKERVREPHNNIHKYYFRALMVCENVLLSAERKIFSLAELFSLKGSEHFVLFKKYLKIKQIHNSTFSLLLLEILDFIN